MAAKKAASKKAAAKKDKKGREPGEDSPIGRKGPRGPKGVDLDSKIKILVSENPKREGSASHTRFELYKAGMTVRAALEAGVRTADIVYDKEHEFINYA